MKKKVPVSELKPGMFIEELDRPWIETPYLIEGILISSQSDIDELANYCSYVYISTEEDVPLQKPTPTITQSTTHAIPEDKGEKTPFHGNHIYIDTHPVEEELPLATKARKKALALMEQIKNKIDRDLQLDVNAAKQLVDVIATSMIRNPEAMLLLNELKLSESAYYYTHAINNATYLIAFGRHLCLPTDELANLGLGGLLMDIGVLKLAKKSADINPGLLQKENIMYAEHVKYGQEILVKIPGISESVLKIASEHHEREDRSGYPKGLAGNQISPYGRMAAIVDCYEKMITEGLTSEYPPLTPFEALKMLWHWTHRWLNATLVQQFAHCIGLFPIGSLVELNTGEVAIVLSHNRIKRLLPKVMIILDKNKQPYNTPITCDLASSVPDSGSRVVEIMRDLEANAYGINPSEYYL